MHTERRDHVQGFGFAAVRLATRPVTPCAYDPAMLCRRCPAHSVGGCLAVWTLPMLGAWSRRDVQQSYSGTACAAFRPAAPGRSRLSGPVQGPDRGCIPSRIFAPTCTGARSVAWIRSPRPARISSCTCGGCKNSAATRPAQFRVGSQWWPASTTPASSMACSSTPQPTTCAARTCHRSHPPSG